MRSRTVKASKSFRLTQSNLLDGTEYAAALVNRYEVGHDGKTRQELEVNLFFHRHPIGKRLAKMRACGGWKEAGVEVGRRRSQEVEAFVSGTAPSLAST